jgi:hypothetical protein
MNRSLVRLRLSAILLAFAAVSATASCDMAGDLIANVKDQLPADSLTSRPAERAPRPTGVVSTGPAIVVSSQIVESSGGSVRVQRAGDPLDGLELVIPAGSYPETRQVNISHAPVTNHTFGDRFNPVTPLIIVENGGQYSDELMTMRIPVDVPPDHFAMAFYYNEEDGTLEGIPTAGVESDSITIVTRHFSTLLVSIISNTVLDDLLKGGIDSGFRPGADDWQFVNRGSFLAPGGHCAGQSLAAMWYYCEQPDGEDPFLWGLYDNNGKNPATPDLWEDDSDGYRLASIIQDDIDWDSFANSFMFHLRGASDELAFKAFAYGMYLTGEPQEVGIFSSAGGGHDMIVYRVDSKGLSIADPNYPGNAERRIEYSAGVFTPYNSGANADEIAAGNGKAYETIQYCAKTATVDWGLIGRRWNELKDGTIGDDSFPQYEVVVESDEGEEEPLADGYESQHREIRIRINGDVPIGARVFLDGVRIQPDTQGKYELNDGNNLIGVSVWGDVANDPQNRRYKYIDFQYFNVTYGETECEGWLLESVTPSVATYDAGDPRFHQNFTLDSTDGAYTSEGYIVLPMLEEDSVAHFRHTGGWSQLPSCLKENETVVIILNAATALEIIPPVEWGSVYNFLALSLDVPQAELGRISLQAKFQDVPGMASRRVELNLGEGFEGLEHEVIVQFETETGGGEYRYKYVWRG